MRVSTYSVCSCVASADHCVDVQMRRQIVVNNSENSDADDNSIVKNDKDKMAAKQVLITSINYHYPLLFVAHMHSRVISSMCDCVFLHSRRKMA